MIDNKILSSIIKSNNSSHEEHDESNLCDMCILKRSIWFNKELRELALNCVLLYTVESWPVNELVLETVILGFILGKQYAESLQLNEKYNEKTHS
jgi:hypothetical protein